VSKDYSVVVLSHSGHGFSVYYANNMHTQSQTHTHTHTPWQSHHSIGATVLHRRRRWLAYNGANYRRQHVCSVQLQAQTA